MRHSAKTPFSLAYIRHLSLLIFLIVCSLVGFSQPDTIRYTGSPIFCQGGSLLLSADPAPGGATYAWQLNGGNNGNNSTYLVNQTGLVTLTVNGAAYRSLQVTVNPKPAATFTFTNNNTCSGTPIQFSSNIASGTAPYNYSWVFGDATTSSLANPVTGLRLLGCGTASVFNSLTVTDANGCVGAVNTPISVLHVPDVQLSDSNTFFPFKNCQNSPNISKPTYRLKLNNVSPSAGCINSYAIDWGDGNVQSGLTNASFPLVHTYTQLGAFNLIVTALGANGCSNSKAYVVANQSNPAGSLGTLGATTGLCAPATVPFTISNWENNSPGTTYSLNFDDGVTIVLNHPLNPGYTVETVNHTYTKSSCPSPLTYTAKLNVINACDITPYTAGNIQVRIKPIAAFTSPNPACVSQPVVFTNTTTAGYYGPSCSSQAIYSWDFGDPISGVNNISDLQNPTHIYSSIGLYTVTLTANNPCGTTTFNKQICIVAQPIPSFTIDNSTGCFPLTVNATNTSNTLTSCSPPTYNWTVTYSAANCGTPTSPIFIFSNGTNSASVNPSFLFTNPGNYSIKLSITNPCGTYNITQVVAVKRPPAVSLPNYPNVCGPVTITPSATVVNCGSNTLTYLWTFMGGTPASSTNPNPGLISFSTLGTNGITLSVTNECGTTTVSKQFTISQIPDITVPPNQNVCKGFPTGILTFSSTLAGTTFNWTNNTTAIGLAASGTGNIPSFIAQNSGTTPITATITVTPVNGCSGTPSSFTITVYPIPGTPSVSTPVNYCQGAMAVPLTATPAGTNTLNWYTAAMGGTASSTAPTPLTTIIGTTIYYVSQTAMPAGCEGPRAPITVTIKAVPNISDSSFTNPTSCGSATGAISLIGLANNTSYSVTYSKNGSPVSVTLSSNASGILTITGLSAGIYSNVKVTLNGCPSNEKGPFSLADPTSPATPMAGSNSPLCSGATLNLTSSTTSPGAPTYTWSGPNGFASTLQNPFINNVTVAATGTYNVTVKISGCTSSAGAVMVVVSSVGTISNAGPDQKLCNLTSATLAANAPATGTGLWTQVAGPLATIANATIANTGVSGLQIDAVYKFVWEISSTNAMCGSSKDTVIILSRPNVTIAAAGVDSTFCAGSGSNYMLEGNTPRIYETGLWTIVSTTMVPAPTLTNASNPKAVVNGLSIGTLTLKWTLNNDAGCTPSADQMVITISGAATQANAGPDKELCNSTVATLAGNTATNGIGSWTVVAPSTAIVTQPNNETSGITNLPAGITKIVWSISNSTCPPTRDTVQINNLLPVLNTVSPLTNTICAGQTATITGAIPTGGNNMYSYQWQQSANNITFTNISGAVLKDITVSPLTATYYRRAITSGACVSNSDTVLVNVSSVATISNAGPDQKLCNLSSATLAANAPATGTGLWTQVTGPTATIANAAIANTGVSGLQIDSVYKFVWEISSTNSMCGSSRDTVIILSRPAVTIAAAGVDSTFCAGSGSTFTLQGNTPRIYETGLWTIVSTTMVPVPTIASASNPNAVVNGLSIGTLTFKWTLNNDAGCTPSSDQMVITITGAATQANAGQDKELCNSTVATLAGNTATNGIGSWIVVAPSTAMITSPNSPSSSITNLPAGITKLVWSISNNVCPATRDTIQINNLLPVLNTVSPLTNTICAGQTATLTGALPTGGNNMYNYQWQQSADNINFTNITGAVAKDVTVSPTTTTYYRRIINSGACVSNSDTALVAVLANISNNAITGNQTICINTIPSTITGSVPSGGGGAFGFIWEQSIDGGTTWTIIPGATNQNFSPLVLAVNTQYRRKVNTALCSGPQAVTSNVITITLNPDATALFNPTKSKGCVPFVITPAIINLTPFNTSVFEYRWYVNGGYIGSGQIFPGYTMNIPGDSSTIKLVAVSRFGCKNDSMQRGFITVARPVPAFAQSDSVGCGPLSVLFTNNTPNAGQYSFLWNFGNGQTSTLRQPAAIAFAPNPLSGDTVYTVTFKTFSECDTILLQRFVRVKSKPKALFTPDKTVGCSGYNFTFTNTTRGINVNCTWDFGDGSPLLVTNAVQVNHVYRVGISDTFKVKLKATNECGTDSLIYNVVVNPITIRLDFAINGNQRFGCAPHLVQFINNSTGGNIYTWDFGDGSSVTTIKGIDTIPHVYALPGNYTITLRGTNNCSDTSDTELVTVNLKPAVLFTASPIIACIGDTIRYTNLSDTGLVYNWRFGDGSTSVLTSPKKIFGTAGLFRTWLIGSRSYASGNTCADSAFKDITIRDTLPGLMGASDSISNCAPIAITFKNLNRPSISTNWNFGDGSFGMGDSIIHTYTMPGTYVVKMTSKGLGGCNYTATKNIVINGPAGLLRYNGGYICLGNAMQFETIATGASQYRFVFGDGDSVTQASNLISHVYTRPGIYIPYAWLLSGNCQVKVFTGDTVKVDRVKAGFKTTAQQVCGATTISFTDTSNAYFGIGTRLWNFGDGTFSSQQNPNKTFTQSGVYNIRLRVVGISGCVDTVLVPLVVDVHIKPVSTITGDSLACIGQPLAFAALVQSQDAITGYDWNFGNGNTANGINVSATYNAAGTYTVRLISRTSFGCADTVFKTMRVNIAPIVNAGNDVRICLGQSVQLNAVGANTWQWSPLQNLSCTNCSNPVASPKFTTTYAVTGSNAVNCKTTDSITVEVVQPFNITVSNNDTICIGQTSQLFASGGFRYSWNPSVGLDRNDVPNPISTPLSTTLYRVIGFDQYNCFSDTGFVRVAVGQYPTVDLGNGGLVVAGTNVNLNAIITGGPIASYRWTPSRDLSCTNCGNPVATINTNILYKLEIENFYGCTASDTISFKVNCDISQVYIPNAFSPDGDGINDILMVRAKGIAQVKYFRIFNRWGQLVFERSNINANDPQQGWHGKVNGIPANPDVYVYTAEAICTAGGTYVYKGNVTLVR